MRWQSLPALSPSLTRLPRSSTAGSVAETGRMLTRALLSIDFSRRSAHANVGFGSVPRKVPETFDKRALFVSCFYPPHKHFLVLTTRMLIQLHKNPRATTLSRPSHTRASKNVRRQLLFFSCVVMLATLVQTRSERMRNSLFCRTLRPHAVDTVVAGRLDR